MPLAKGSPEKKRGGERRGGNAREREAVKKNPGKLSTQGQVFEKGVLPYLTGMLNSSRVAGKLRKPYRYVKGGGEGQRGPE